MNRIQKFTSFVYTKASWAGDQQRALQALDQLAPQANEQLVRAWLHVILYDQQAACGMHSATSPPISRRLTVAGQILRINNVILLNWQRNTYGIRCTPFAAHVRKRLRYAAPDLRPGY
ncbi:MAG: hypothetical protein PF495_01055 [Spirochaetales bacterium]|jgi:hypothetical protein|nr:hypothetical protein [Spirochaetales bacterium]